MGRTQGRNRRTVALLAVVAMALITFPLVSAASHVRVGTLWDEFGPSGEEAWGGTAMV